LDCTSTESAGAFDVAAGAFDDACGFTAGAGGAGGGTLFFLIAPANGATGGALFLAGPEATVDAAGGALRFLLSLEAWPGPVFFGSVEAAAEAGGTLFFFDSAVPGLLVDALLAALAVAPAARAVSGGGEAVDGLGNPVCS
jgi:hypothetical protein